MRLDKYLFEHNYFESRSKAEQAILQGAVYVDGKPQTKASFCINENSSVEIVKKIDKYVSRAGYKLEGAINTFDIDFNDKNVLDIGSSTGGFTDCALQYGAKSVVSVDVGKDQLHTKLKNNPKVISFENTNITDVDKSVFEQIDIIVCDVSFVAGSYIFEKISKNIKPNTIIVWLVKPQFECGKQIASKYKGVITNTELSLQIAQNAVEKVTKSGYEKINFAVSPIKGGDGNTEYLCLLKRSE